MIPAAVTDDTAASLLPSGRGSRQTFAVWFIQFSKSEASGWGWTGQGLPDAGTVVFGKPGLDKAPVIKHVSHA